eukprot:1158979-Pelagomonas_calceolata.AAC.3
MVSQAPSSNPSARRLKPVTPTQLLADQARLARAHASKKGQPAQQMHPLGRLPVKTIRTGRGRTLYGE